MDEVKTTIIGKKPFTYNTDLEKHLKSLGVEVRWVPRLTYREGFQFYTDKSWIHLIKIEDWFSTTDLIIKER